MYAGTAVTFEFLPGPPGVPSQHLGSHPSDPHSVNVCMCTCSHTTHTHKLSFQKWGDTSRAQTNLLHSKQATIIERLKPSASKTFLHTIRLIRMHGVSNIHNSTHNACVKMVTKRWIEMMTALTNTTTTARKNDANVDGLTHFSIQLQASKSSSPQSWRYSAHELDLWRLPTNEILSRMRTFSLGLFQFQTYLKCMADHLLYQIFLLMSMPQFWGRFEKAWRTLGVNGPMSFAVLMTLNCSCHTLGRFWCHSQC